MAYLLGHLTRREREIVSVIFSLGNTASVEDIRQHLADPPSASSVRVMLARLQNKEVLRCQAQGIRNVYSVAVSATSAQRQSLQHHARTFFNGSLRQMLVAMVREESWTDGDLTSLRAEIDRVRRERGRK